MGLLIWCSGSFAQNIYFPPSAYADSASIAQNMPSLARKVLAQYKQPDRTTYIDNLFRLQIVAGDYYGAIKNIDTFYHIVIPDTVDIPGYGFHYKTYLATMNTLEKDSSSSFTDQYPTIFARMYRALSLKATSVVDGIFTQNLANLKKDFDEKIAAQKKSAKDSISVAAATRLCRSWCLYFVYNKTAPGKIWINQLDKENFVSDDSAIIKMPDGGSIALTIVRPKRLTTPQPVILMYSIYPGADHRDAKYAAIKGYVGIIANTRGKRLSPEDPKPFEYDAKDAYAIVDWISKQPWCNGKIGMYGGSYLGFAQWSAVKFLHPALKTIVPQVAVGAGIDYPMFNGVFMSYMLQWIHYVVNNKYTDDQEFNNSEKWDSLDANWYTSGRSYRALDTLDNRPNAIFQRWLDHPSYDSYWQNMTPQASEFAKLNIPILTISGYWDADQLGAMYYFKQHTLWNKNATHYLLVGPYNHSGAQGYPGKVLAGYTLDSAANIPIQDIVFGWFDHVLRDSSLPAILSDRVNFEVMGANKWEHGPSLNKMSNDSLILYFSGITTGDHYKLVSVKPPGTEYITQEVDLKERTTKQSEGDADRGFIDSTMSQDNKLVFKTDTMTKNTILSGSITASLLLSANKKDLDIEYILYEQMPDGKYFFLNHNLQRASYARDRTKRHLLQPGHPEEIPLYNNFLTCIQLPVGSRLVVVIGINKNPDFQVNYGTGKDVSDETIADAKEPLLVKWYSTSKLKIPIWTQPTP